MPNSNRDAVLGSDWRISKDRAWATSGDATGFHILVADRKDGYSWRTVAILSESGLDDTDMWIGNACVTGSGKRAVVAYAPRTFTNKAELMARGAFTAVVDLDSGKVTKLDRQASLAYFNPGCGKDETVVLTQAGGETHNATRLLKVDASAGRIGKVIELPGQVTSAIPVGKDIVAADGARLARIDDEGHTAAIAHTNKVPFGLAADADGGVVFMDRSAGSAEQGEVKRVNAQDISHTDTAKAKPSLLAKGKLARMDLSASAGGKVFITGETKTAGQLPPTVTHRADVPKGSIATTRGEALVTRVTSDAGADPRTPRTSHLQPTEIDVKVLNSGKTATFTVPPPSPAAPAAPEAKAALTTVPANEATDEPERYCAVPRNNPAKQAIQPKPRQVEWAVDQIVNGTLDKNISRPANWKNLGMSAYQPQTLFPRLGLNGGGRIPAQVLLGITAQESNMWQASRVVVPGVTGNPLVGNYYGIKYAASGQQTDPWAINWAEADCGYGVTQITDGMRMHGKEKPGESQLTTLQQEAAALDYAANIAAGQRILADKWNVTNADGLKVNNGDPKYLENWFYALWAYNSGYYPKAAAASNNGLWGVGFTNNPANPLWKANRTPFLEGAISGGNDYTDARHPQDWPYQEKVLGWAARPLQALESPGNMVVGFRPAAWNSNAMRTTVKPPEGLFCTAANSCDPSKIGPDDKNDPGLGACNRSDLKCWWNQPVTWKNCTTKAECGSEVMRFNDTYTEEADGTAYPPNCTTQGLPANALIVDDVADGTPISRPGCSLPKATSGTFSLDFATPSAKIDFQQLGAGYGGHFWFAHTRQAGTEGDRMKVTGTWKLNQTLNSDAKIYVHIPDHGAHAKKARYEINTKNGWRERVIEQPGSGNRWISLGAFRFKGSVPEVRLTTITSDGTGDEDIAFDAVAFEPGTWNMLPDIVIPAENLSAPEPDFVDNDKQKQPIPQGPTAARKDSPNLSAGQNPAEDCRDTTNKKVRQCVTLDYDLGKYKTSPAKSPSASSTAGSDDPLVSWCNDPSVTGYTITRREGCHKLAVLTRWEKDGKTVGTAAFMVREETVVSNSAEFYQRTFISPMSISPTLGAVTLDYWDALCITNCSSSLDGAWNGSTTWTGSSDTHWASATRKFAWTKPVSGTFEDLDRGTVLKFSAASPDAAGAVETKAPSWTFWDEIQCDNGVAVANSTGCVFGKHIPTWQADTNRYPPAAAYYWVMREKLPTHPGSKAHGTPMHRLKDARMARQNRETICNRTGDYAWTPHNDATPDARNRIQCDEFPFAASQESGGSWLPLINGGSCVQLYAQVQSDNTWRLITDDRTDPPTWQEICGRAAMPGQDNMDAGRGPGLSGFYTKARVLDTRAFYLEVPGYEGCNVDSVCIPHP